MSTAPRGGILYRYIPGTGRVAAVECGSSTTGTTGTCATAFSTSDQLLTAGTAALVLHDTVDFSYGITTSSSTFTVPATGVYKIIPSLQCLGAGNGTITIWIKVNGANVDNTGTRTAFKNNDETVITCEYLLQLNAGDSMQVWALAQGANCTIDYIAGDGTPPNTYPAAPGVITNVYRIR